MTQIVWDGRFLIADRKCFRGTTVFAAQKLRVKHNGKQSTAFAFAGTYEECNIADQVMMAEDNRELIEQAKSILTDPAGNWQGLCVETQVDERPKAYLCNYLGMREELPANTFFAVGACADELMFAYRTWQAIAANLDKPAHTLFTGGSVTVDEERTIERHITALACFLRTALKGSYYDQYGYPFDVYDSVTGYTSCA
nr:MAG TPA: hypothetical protein [Caudoviricetes sp.]